MPPPLALFFCTVFVLWLLRLDQRQSARVTSVSWLPTLWFFSIASKPIAVWFGWGASAAEGGSPLDRTFLLILLFLGVAVIMQRGLPWSHFFSEYCWVFILLGFMFLSIAWTENSFVSFKRWARELTAVVMALVVATEPYPREAFMSMLRRMCYVLVPFSILLIKYFPHYGVAFHDYTGAVMWVGVTTQKNSLGRLCLLSAIFLFWTLLRRYRGVDQPVARHQTLAECGVLLLALWLLKGPGLAAYSATSVAALGVGFLILIGLLRTQRRGLAPPHRRLWLMIVAIVGIGVVTPFVGGTTVGFLSSFLGRDATLTGRTVIWEGALEHAQPLLGSGIGAFWTWEIREKLQIGIGHNGYLEAFLNYGIVGLPVVMIFLLSCGKKALRALHEDFEWGCLGVSIFTIVILHNYSESSIHSLATHMTATILVFAVSSMGLLRSGNSLEVESIGEDPLAARH